MRMALNCSVWQSNFCLFLSSNYYYYYCVTKRQTHCQCCECPAVRCPAVRRANNSRVEFFLHQPLSSTQQFESVIIRHTHTQTIKDWVVLFPMNNCKYTSSVRSFCVLSDQKMRSAIHIQTCHHPTQPLTNGLYMIHLLLCNHTNQIALPVQT